ncbi:MAG: carboxypeptidase regulatory-like domain-containing protein [Saprospiraceae bacterium]|nr:carboxypeptidase regulatory-like domain-containing protein [Saprospiraceae bacterium]
MNGSLRIILVLLFLGAISLAGWSQTSLQGRVTDGESGDVLIFCNVALYKNGVLITGTESDEDGNYAISNLDPGTYDLEVSYAGYQTQRVTGVLILAGRVNKVDVALSQGVILDEVVVTDYKVPLIEQDNTTSGGVVTSEQIRNLPTKSISTIAATTAGISSRDGENVAVRGSRTNATDYYVDGIRVFGNLVPQSEIDQLQVITGGIEARYGDVTGGIISITTKGPSNQLSGGLEIESSQYLDAFGYKEANAYLSGPILRNKSGKSILGYRLSGRFLYQDENNPPAVDVYVAPGSLIRDLEENPIRTVAGTSFATGEFLHDEDVQTLKARPNEDFQSLDVTAKLDAQISRNVDLTLSGSYRNVEDQFAPSTSWLLLNYENNPIDYNQRARVNLRLRHRLGGDNNDENRTRVGLIQNATYTIQAGYEQATGRQEDLRHQDHLFRYGHIGTFDFSWEPAEGESTYSGAIMGLSHAGFLQVLNDTYIPSEFNPVLANYNKNIDQSVFGQYRNYNGFTSNSTNSLWGYHRNVGSVYNTFNRFISDRYTFNVGGSFDLVPWGSDKGRHSIDLGLIHEQSYNRSWAVAPFGLWEVARLQANRQIIGVDTTQVVGSFPGIVFPGIVFEEFEKLVVEDSDLKFYRAIREKLGLPITEYVNVDGIHPDDLSLDLFSPLELTDQRIVSYYGYDYLGNRISQDVEFDDFFNSVGPDGRRSFVVGPNKPIYQAAYIQDKFSFRDIIFRLGLRVDRYDANTKVLRDPYSLYEIMDAETFYNQTGIDRPNNVGDDFKVYIEEPGSDNVRAFRNGDQWYFANGTPANDGNVIFGGGLVYPKLYEDRVNNIKSNDFDPSNSFEDYKAQVNWMPRLAVSFPISDIANFFAHYDVLVQRPPSNSIATPLTWYYFEDDTYNASNPLNNSNLKPERTIDYEVGFQQKLSNSSALKINAYYKELRDMLQQQTYLYVPAPINSYVTIGNLDFGTVKGFSLQYDLRRSINTTIQANYTLQFADGTGSNVNSQRGLTTRGNLRSLFPLDRDERHAFKFTFDYRYGSGRTYNGPVLFNKNILSNFGINLQSFIVSGRPYTREIRPLPFGGSGFFGSINGARQPWTFSIDGRMDKSFLIATSREKPLSINVSLRVLNLLNAKNVRNVYSVTGSPYDSGFLLSSDGESTLFNINSTGEQVVEEGRDAQAYQDAYNWLLASPANFYLPRRIFLGIRFDF